MPPQISLIDLYSDPITVPNTDSSQWIALFRLIGTSDKLNHLSNAQRFDLLTTLWQFRGLGTVIRGGKLSPLIYPNGKWESQAMFEECTQFLKPYASELKLLIQESEGGNLTCNTTSSITVGH